MRKFVCIGNILKLVGELAKYKGIDDFDLDLELLDTLEGRKELN